MKLMSIDVSGNFKEGKGTTGLAFFEDDKLIDLGEIKASNYETAEEYWMMHVALIEKVFPDHIVIEGYKLYNHKKSEQVNSELETPQLIGILKMTCHMWNIPYTIQFASEVKQRWSDKVLQAKNILDSNNKWNGASTNNHKRDALRHGLHWLRYKKGAE